MNKCKVIFLDFDGVLSSWKSWDLWHEEVGERAHVTLPHKIHIDPLNKILKETNAHIVVSSTWRLQYMKSTLGTRMMEQLLVMGGMRHGRIIGFTPRLSKQKRGDEIQKWMDEYVFRKDKYIMKRKDNTTYIPFDETWYGDIESFVILDDDSDMCHLSDKLIKTSYDDGLTFELADKAIELLNGE